MNNVLKEAGVLRGEHENAPTQYLDVPLEGAYVTSETDGLVEWTVALGDPISEGQVIARVHDPRHLGRAPVEYSATMHGILAMRHFPGLLRMGDALAMQGRIVDPV